MIKHQNFLSFPFSFNRSIPYLKLITILFVKINYWSHHQIFALSRFCSIATVCLHACIILHDAIKNNTQSYLHGCNLLQAWSRETIKRYSCKLYRESSDHPRQLVLIETHNCKCAPKDVEIIQLEKVLKVTLEKGLIKEKSLFHIFTLNGKYTLGTDSLEKTEGWIRILNREIFGPPEHNVVCKYI